MAITLDTPLDQFPGVGEARAKKLAKLGLTRCAQLLTYFPRDYEDRREIYSIRSAPLGRKVCVRAMAAEHPRLARIRRGLELVQLRVVDQAGALHLTFFNQSYVERPSVPGRSISFSGLWRSRGAAGLWSTPSSSLRTAGTPPAASSPSTPDRRDLQPPDALPHPAGGGCLRRSRSGDATPVDPSGTRSCPGGVCLSEHPFS